MAAPDEAAAEWDKAEAVRDTAAMGAMIRPRVPPTCFCTRPPEAGPVAAAVRLGRAAPADCVRSQMRIGSGPGWVDTSVGYK